MKVDVWILYHNWGSGDHSIQAYGSKQELLNALYKYVSDQWHEGIMEGEPTLLSPTEVIKTYFDWHEDSEWHSISTDTVDLPQLGLGADDEIVLTGEEIDTLIQVLSGTMYTRIAGLLGVDIDKQKGQVIDHVEGILAKLGAT